MSRPETNFIIQPVPVRPSDATPGVHASDEDAEAMYAKPYPKRYKNSRALTDGRLHQRADPALPLPLFKTAGLNSTSIVVDGLPVTDGDEYTVRLWFKIAESSFWKHSDFTYSTTD